MDEKKYLKTAHNQKGQALLFVLVAMTIALAVGINIAMRTLSSISRTARTDTAERVRAAAEGGIERALGASTSSLSALANSGASAATCNDVNLNYDSTLGSCIVSFPQAWADEIDARALVSVTTFSYTDPSLGVYRVPLESGTTVEVQIWGMGGSLITICIDPIPQGDVAYTFYGETGILSKGGITTGTIGGSYQAVNFLTPNQSNVYGFSRCRSNISVPSNSYGLRLTAIGGNIDIGVVSDILPQQGFKITSIGELVQEGVVRTTKEVNVYKSYPYLPTIFDFGLYSSTDLN
jgi:hypothetical protein